MGTESGATLTLNDSIAGATDLTAGTGNGKWLSKKDPHLKNETREAKNQHPFAIAMDEA